MTTETAPRTAPAEPITPITPSQAIRLGCLLAPIQDFGSLGSGQRACVMGAMMLGFGGKEIDALGLTNDFVRTFWADCPVCGNAPGAAVVPHLNDDHRWTRERIADWLEDQGL